MDQSASFDPAERRTILAHAVAVIFVFFFSYFSLLVSLLLLVPFLAVAFADKFTVLFRYAMDKFPWLRKWFWEKWYNFCGNRTDKDVVFMNYGYAPKAGEAPIELSSQWEHNRYCAQLYYTVATAAGKLAGKTVLEVGSGRGGGASFIARELKPKKIVGLDFSQENIARAQGTFKESNLSFVQGDAENLPFPDNEFDAVVNVESSHCYGNVDKFLSEVRRVLKPGGHFLFVDLRGRDKFEELKSSIAACGMKELHFRDITDNVLLALENESPRKERFIAEKVPFYLRFVLREFMAVKGSNVHKAFASRTLRYVHYVMQKVGGAAGGDAAAAASSSSSSTSRAAPVSDENAPLAAAQ